MGTMEEMGFSSMTVEFRNVAASGDVVFTERIGLDDSPGRLSRRALPGGGRD